MDSTSLQVANDELRQKIAIEGGLDERVAAIASPGAPLEFIAAVRDVVRAQLERAKERAKAVDEAMLEHIEATGEDIVIGDVRYYAAHPKDIDCPDKEATAVAVLEAVGGDMRRFGECLSSDAFKPGACRKVLAPEVFDRCFVTTVRDKLAEGKPAAKRLVAADTRFLPGRNER